MTDELEVLDQPAIPEQVPENTQSEEMLPKSTISKIVERERLKAFEKGKQEGRMENQQQEQPVQQDMQQQAPQVQMMQQQSQGLGGMPQMSQDQIEQLIMQKAPQALMQQVNQMKNENMVQSFVGKMQAAEQRHPGLEEKLNKLNYNDPAMHSLIEMSNNLENTGDVMKELLDNPSKLSQVLMGIERQPYLAQEQLSSLSNSIKQNVEAKAQEEKAHDPMSQLKPSNNAQMADMNSASIQDLQRMLSQRK